MRIDNSQAKLFFECPLKAHIRYDENLELRERDTSSLDFGTRFHTLQSERHLGREFCSYCGAGLGAFRREGEGLCEHCQPLPDARLEAEVQATFQAYLQYYPSDPWEVVECERTLEVPLNTRHTLAFKIDLLVRDASGLAILDYKTEKRGGQNNSPEAWAARSQVSLYQWAASRFYGEPVGAIYLDVTTRGSAKGQEGPIFQRQRLVRTEAQQLGAVENICWVADRIEGMNASGFFPQNTESCKASWRKCDYFALCHIGRTDGNLRLYQPAKPYLDL